MQIQRFLLLESGTYNDMYFRPYEANVDVNTVTALEEAIAHKPQISGVSLAGIAGRIVAPSAVTQGNVGIANGWGERRFFYMLEVDLPSNFGAGLKQVICGYSNYVGASLQSQALDPRMELFINSVTTLRQTVEDRGWGPQIFWVPQDNSQLLIGDYSPSLTTVGNQPSSIRPMDVFDTVGMSSVPPDAMRLDQRTTFSDGARKSRRSNNSSSTYLSRIINAASQAFAGSMDFNDQETALMTASETVQEGLVSDDTFMAFMRNRGCFTPNGSFQLQSIFAIDPALSASMDQRMTVIFKSKNPMMIGSNSHERGSTEGWKGNTFETTFANALAQAIPALMTDCLLTKANINFTNRTMDGLFHISPDMPDPSQPGVRPEDMEPINGFVRGMDITPYVKRFFMRLEHEVLADISQRGFYDIAGSIRSEVTGETWIRISVGGQQPVDFVYPSFSDALLAPTMSPNQQFLGDLSGKLGVLINTINTNPGSGMSKESQVYNPYSGPVSSSQMNEPSNNFNQVDPYGTSGSL
jgi:hypothetical protein